MIDMYYICAISIDIPKTARNRQHHRTSSYRLIYCVVFIEKKNLFLCFPGEDLNLSKEEVDEYYDQEAARRTVAFNENLMLEQQRVVSELIDKHSKEMLNLLSQKVSLVCQIFALIVFLSCLGK